MAYRALHSINQYQVSIRRGPSRKRLWQPFQTKQLTWPVGQNKLGRALLAFHFPQVLPNLKIICSVYLKKKKKIRGNAMPSFFFSFSALSALSTLWRFTTGTPCKYPGPAGWSSSRWTSRTRRASSARAPSTSWPSARTSTSAACPPSGSCRPTSPSGKRLEDAFKR